MSSKSIIVAIEKAIYTGYLDIVEFTNAAEDRVFYEYFTDSRHAAARKSASMDLHFIEDFLLRRKIVEFLYNCMDSTNINPDTFYSYRIRGVLQLHDKFPTLFKLDFKHFLIEADTLLKNEERLGNSKAFLHTFSKYCNMIEHIDNPLMMDEWEIEWFNMSSERNYAKRFRRIVFTAIRNDRNRFLVKKYIEYCFRNTDNSINTIMGKTGTLRTLLNLEEKPLDEWNSDDAKHFISIIVDRYSKKATLASRLIILFQFIDYLLIHDYIDDNPIKQYKDLARIGEFHHKTSAVDHSVVKKIFEALADVDEPRVVLCFLLIYCTGMRLSEACTIKTDCIEKTNSGTFVHYYSLKMKKVIIPRCGKHQSVTRKAVIRVKESTNPKRGNHQSTAGKHLPM